MDTKALFKFSSGLYVVSAKDGDDYGACVINTGLQLTSEPLQVQVVVNKQNHTEGVIERAGHFALCAITEEADMPYIGRFGFRTSTAFDKFAGIECAETVYPGVRGLRHRVQGGADARCGYAHDLRGRGQGRRGAL